MRLPVVCSERGVGMGGCLRASRYMFGWSLALVGLLRQGVFILGQSDRVTAAGAGCPWRDPARADSYVALAASTSSAQPLAVRAERAARTLTEGCRCNQLELRERGPVRSARCWDAVRSEPRDPDAHEGTVPFMDTSRAHQPARLGQEARRDLRRPRVVRRVAHTRAGA